MHEEMRSCYNQNVADAEIPKYAAFLKQLFLFRSLDEAHLAHLVNRVQRLELPKDAPVMQEGEVESDFYVVYQGRVLCSRLEGEVEARLGYFGPGEYFGEESLFDLPSPMSVTVASETAVLLGFGRETMFELIADYPQVGVDLKTTWESRRLAQAKGFDWLDQDEVVYLVTRKHRFFLLLSLIFPTLIGVLALFALVFGLTNAGTAFSDLALIFGVVGLAFSIFLAVWNAVDWGNDYYILTNQRVVWLERVILLYYSRREAPLTHILAVNVTSSWLGRVLGYGTVEVRTFTGSIRMRNADQPYRFAAFVDSFHVRAKEMLRQYEAEDSEKALRQRLQALARGEAERAPEAPAMVEPAKPSRASALRAILDTFLQVRFIEGPVITYRKHWLVLLKKTWLPLVLGVLFTVLVVYLVRSGVFDGVFLALLSGLVYLGLFIWLLYNYLDWSNDIYQLTPDQILDISRKPLGEEIKKSAPLDSILSLEHTREGIIQLLFNYGNVIISVGTTPFVFYGVKNPDQVQQDIISYIEKRRRKKQEDEAARERERLLDWFSAYHRQAETLEDFEKDSDFDLFPG